MAVQLCDCTKTHQTVYMKRVTFMVDDYISTMPLFFLSEHIFLKK